MQFIIHMISNRLSNCFFICLYNSNRNIKRKIVILISFKSTLISLNYAVLKVIQNCGQGNADEQFDQSTSKWTTLKDWIFNEKMVITVWNKVIYASFKFLFHYWTRVRLNYSVTPARYRRLNSSIIHSEFNRRERELGRRSKCQVNWLSGHLQLEWIILLCWPWILQSHSVLFLHMGLRSWVS